ncbi:DNA gyrase subunit A [compost metagenome]
MIRIVVSELRVMGRATQGVRLINLKGNDEIASVAKIEHEDEEVEEGEGAESVVVTDVVATEELGAETEEAAEIEEEEEEEEEDDTEEEEN